MKVYGHTIGYPSLANSKKRTIKVGISMFHFTDIALEIERISGASKF